MLTSNVFRISSQNVGIYKLCYVPHIWVKSQQHRTAPISYGSNVRFLSVLLSECIQSSAIRSFIQKYQHSVFECIRAKLSTLVASLSFRIAVVTARKADGGCGCCSCVLIKGRLSLAITWATISACPKRTKTHNNYVCVCVRVRVDDAPSSVTRFSHFLAKFNYYQRLSAGNSWDFMPI